MKMSPRPLSPHLQIHKPLLTMVFSITHRISAIIFFLSLIFISIWVSTFYTNKVYFDLINSMINHGLSKPLILIWIFCVNHFVLSEIKHLLWSMTKLMEINSVYKISYLILTMNIFLTFFIGFKLFQ